MCLIDAYTVDKATQLIDRTLLRTSLLLLIYLIVGNSTGSFAKDEKTHSLDSQTPSLIDNECTRDVIALDKAIGLECIKLARFSILFHLETNRHQPRRDWLYPLGQETGTALSFSNTIIDLNERAKGLSNLSKISKSARANGLCCAITGSAISASSSAAELLQNGIVEWRASKQGFSEHDSVVYVKNIVNKIDKLLDNRKLVLQSITPSPDREIIELEGFLLKQIRDQLLFEFKKWSIHSRETAWSENTFYAINTAQNFITCGSGIIAYHDLTNQRRSGTAAVCYVVADSLATINPPFRTIVGVCMRKYQRRNLNKIFPEERPAPTKELLEKWNEFDKLLAEKKSSSTNPQLLKEEAILSERSQRLDFHLTTETARIEKLRRVAAQQAISGPLIGMASLARSILYTVAYYGYGKEPATANSLAFAGRISQASGQAYSLIDTPAVAIAHALYKRKLSKRGELPAQILQQRLDRLDALEANIQSFHP